MCFAATAFEDVEGDLTVSIVKECASECKESVAMAGCLFGFLEEFNGFEEEEGAESAFG